MALCFHSCHTLGQQNTQKITTATIAAQPKGVAQIQGSPMGTFQIVHQSSPSSQSVQTTKTVSTAVVQQLQQAFKQGLVVGHNIPHAIHVSQSGTQSNTTSTTTLIPQSILQAVSQSKSAQTIENSQQSAPIAVAQIGPNQQTIKHIQVVSSGTPQSQTSGAAKSIILSGQPILQTSLPSQPQTVTFAIRATQSTVNPQTQQTNTASTAQTTDNPSAGGSVKEGETYEQNDGSNQSASRQSPYATRQKNPNTKN